MAPSANMPPTRVCKSLFLPTMTLALILLRKTRGLLLITGVGFVAAVMLACVVPLYSDVSMTAGLHGALTSSPQNADIVVQSFSEQINPQIIDGATNAIDQEFKNKLGPYLGPPQFSIQTPTLPIDTKLLSSHGSVIFKDTDNQLQLFGSAIDQSASHLTLLQGRLPRTVSTGATYDDLEIALSQESARSLNVTLDSVIYMKVALVYIPTIREVHILPFRLVGIFKPWRQNSRTVSTRLGAPITLNGTLLLTPRFQIPWGQ